MNFLQEQKEKTEEGYRIPIQPQLTTTEITFIDVAISICWNVVIAGIPMPTLPTAILEQFCNGDKLMVAKLVSYCVTVHADHIMDSEPDMTEENDFFCAINAYLAYGDASYDGFDDAIKAFYKASIKVGITNEMTRCKFFDSIKDLFKKKEEQDMETITKLELTDEMIERNDEIDNAVYQCINALAEKEIEWNMEIIGEVTDSIKEILKKFDITVRHPSVVTNEDGTQEYDDETVSKNIVDDMIEWFFDNYEDLINDDSRDTKEKLQEYFGVIVPFNEIDEAAKKIDDAIKKGK